MLTDMQTYSSREVAEMVGLSFSHFRKLMANGECPMPAQKVGQAYVWLDADVKRLKKWLAGRPERRGRKRKNESGSE